MMNLFGETPVRKLLTLHALSGESAPKNLFDKTKVTAGRTWWEGNLAETPGNNASEKIPVIPGETYTLYRSHNKQGVMVFWDENGDYFTQDTEHWSLKTPQTNTIPEGAYFAGFTVDDEGLNTAVFVKGSVLPS